ncbi:FMN-binding negative transcriptional regulator [Aliikangiella coralliicola]|uniref:FMN-binding negative transcriptional regulator n=1 Tax=Aliikangiella coralliicola TaxID=2592383 RepID=A0A545U7I9_9GAMM|nr:FMN-binding negative transcriptional regulator [Aliikangiella coralliicola]TQV85435.1 FMN-binding negative transcriptional regulator [Aliikangiella coralliicola]
MYQPRHFKFDDRQSQLAFIRQYGFGQITSCYQGKLEVNHAPFLLSEDNTELLAHFARQNQHWKLLEKADDINVCFNGPNAYITPNWYTNNSNVPTWNFINVQVSGKCTLMNEAELIDLLDKLSQKHEARFEQPWTIDKLSEKQLSAMLKAIVGFKISIETIEGKAKLSQNKKAQDFDGLLNGLSTQEDDGSIQIYQWMKKVRA